MRHRPPPAGRLHRTARSPPVAAPGRRADPIPFLARLGKATWADEAADAYVERVRVGMGVSRKNIQGIHFIQPLEKAMR